jgi:hypothetical protein
VMQYVQNIHAANAAFLLGYSWIKNDLVEAMLLFCHGVSVMSRDGSKRYLHASWPDIWSVRSGCSSSEPIDPSASNSPIRGRIGTASGNFAGLPAQRGG